MKHAQQKTFLHPGDFCFTDQRIHIHTLLGSCVSITLWHPGLKIGGMCHFMLPKYSGKHNPGRKPDGRYAEDVIKLFKSDVEKFGTSLQEYDAKIFGGGNMMKSEDEDIDDSIGTKNAATAMKLLMQEKVNILVAHVGEFGHRRIVFDVVTGDVWVRHVEKGGVRPDSINGKI